ncbi:hypothetical protein E5288_WYG012966 [Bos mutus]|uniref:Lipid-binding serum glycoprotein N-terminal domain-containing protein n=2 Tax=Bos mutus TaxID=72004 RepID=A0A6B0RCS2_9CETA|nr:hypothetical protein [Bos mutus]
MLPLWRLVLLCGLLTGTSASLLDNNVVRELQSALRKELETDDSASEPVLEKVKADFELLQDFTCLEMIAVKEVLPEKIQDAEIVLDKDNSNNRQLLVRCLRLTIRSISIGNITFQGTPGGTSINLSISITAKVTLTLPLLGAVIDLTLNFVLQRSISFKIDEAGTLMVVLGECTYTPAKISLPFVNSSVSSLTGLMSNIRKTVTTLVNLVETYIVKYVLCPRIGTIISSLNENLVNNLNASQFSSALQLCSGALSRCLDKMFQLWKLVLLCGLLAGTSASLLDSLGKDVLRKLKSGLEKGLDNLDSTLEIRTPYARHPPPPAIKSHFCTSCVVRCIPSIGISGKMRCPDKMFQLWKRVLLCGLLPGTSASLLDSLGKDGLRKLKSGLEKGLDNLDSTLVTILEQLKTAEADPEKTEEAKSLLEQLISGIFEVVYRLTGVNISNLHILNITLEPASDGKGATLKIPITAEVNVNLPVLGEIVDLALNLVLQYSVSVETHEETKVSKVVVEECRSDQQSIKLTVLGRRIGLLTEVVDFAINLVNEVLSLVTHYENLKTELESRCSDEVVEQQETENFLEQLISRIFQVVSRLTGVRIRNVQVPDITFEATSENSANVSIPITADVTVSLPFLGEIVDLDLNVDLQTTVSIETDTDDPQVVVGECTNNPESISLTVLHSRFGLLNDVVDIGVNLARRVVSSVVEGELCPRFRELLESLDAECVEKLIGAHSKMLKVSSLFILLCGLLALSSAQEVLSEVSSQINDVLTKELLSVGFLPSLQNIDLQESLQNVFSQPAGLLDINSDSNVVVELEDPRLIQVFLQDSVNNKEAELLVALAFSVHTKLPVLNPLIFQVRTNMKVQLRLEKDVNGMYRLTFGHCRLVPESVRIQSGSLTSRIPNFVWEYVEITIKNLIINNLGEKVCPFINSWLYNLNPQVANELMNWLLQQSGYQAAIEIASK